MPDWLASYWLTVAQGLGALHFIRPIYLAGLVLAGILYGVMWYRHDIHRQWRNFVAPHLLDHLVVRPPQRLVPGPRAWLGVTLALASLAMAGPTWQRQPSPFVSDQAPLVVVLSLASGMDATDVQPSRLLRAEQKLRELMQRRRGARTALLVFGTSAHRVLPLTDDTNLLISYLATLRTDLLPQRSGPSSAMVDALHMAKEVLAEETTPGSVLLLTDDVAPLTDGVPSPRQTILWTFGSDINGRPLVERHHLPWVEASLTDADVHEINFRIQSQLENALSGDELTPWEDAGPILLWPLLLLVAAGFRRGWVVRWP